MTYPLKPSYFKPPPPPLSRCVLNRTSLIATTLYPLMEGISCYLRHSLQGNIVSASSQDIHLYSPNSSGNKIYPHQSSQLIVLLTTSFSSSRKYYEYGKDTEKTTHGQEHLSKIIMLVASLMKHTLPPPPSQNIQNLLKPSPCLGRHLWMTPNSLENYYVIFFVNKTIGYSRKEGVSIQDAFLIARKMYIPC